MMLYSTSIKCNNASTEFRCCTSARVSRGEAIARFVSTPDSTPGYLASIFTMGHAQVYRSPAVRPSSARRASACVTPSTERRPKSAKSRYGAQPGGGPIMKPPWTELPSLQSANPVFPAVSYLQQNFYHFCAVGVLNFTIRIGDIECSDQHNIAGYDRTWKEYHENFQLEQD